jgi:hypothetical protein
MVMSAIIGISAVCESQESNYLPTSAINTPNGSSVTSLSLVPSLQCDSQTLTE